MRDVEYRPGEQCRLTIAHELAHRGVGAEETAASGLDLDLADAADVEHGPERRFALAENGFGAFEVGDVGDCCNQPDDFVVPPLWLIVAMHELRPADLVRHFGLEFERLAGEALADVVIESGVGFFPEHLGNSFADYLLGRETEPFRIVPVDELIAGFCVAVGDCNMDVVSDKAQLAFAVAQQILCRLRANSLSMLCHRRIAPRRWCLRLPAVDRTLPERFGREPRGRSSAP